MHRLIDLLRLGIHDAIKSDRIDIFRQVLSQRQRVHIFGPLTQRIGESKLFWIDQVDPEEKMCSALVKLVLYYLTMPGSNIVDVQLHHCTDCQVDSFKLKFIFMYPRMIQSI